MMLLRNESADEVWVTQVAEVAVRVSPAGTRRAFQLSYHVENKPRSAPPQRPAK
jgi:hypothetical protein